MTWFLPGVYLLVLLLWLLPHNPRNWLLHESGSWYTWITCHFISGTWKNLLLSLALLVLAGMPVEIRHPRLTPALFAGFALLQSLGHQLLGEFVFYGSPLGIALAFCTFNALDGLSRPPLQRGTSYSVLLVLFIASIAELSTPGLLYAFLPLHEAPRSGITWFVALFSGTLAYLPTLIPRSTPRE